MANVKISGLPVATSAAGADLFAIVQGGVTKQLTNTLLFTSPTFVTPVLGTPASGNLANCLGYSGANLSGIVAVANGGTGLATLTANAVITGNGTSTPGSVAPGTVGNILTSNGTIWQSTAPAAGGLSAATTKTAAYTAVAGDVIAANTITTGAFSITLPASPTAGQKPIIIFDSGTTDVINGFATNNLTVLRNGSTINTLSDDVTFSTKGVSVIFEYIAGTWRMRIG